MIVLDKKEGEAYRDVFDIVPPPEKEYQALTTDTERALNDRRFMYEDSLRNAYIARFMDKEEAGNWRKSGAMIRICFSAISKLPGEIIRKSFGFWNR